MSFPQQHTAPRTTPRFSAKPQAPAVSRRQAPPKAGHSATQSERRQLRRDENTQVRQLQTKQRRELRDLRTSGQRPDRDRVRQLQTQHQQQIRDLHQQFRDKRAGSQRPQQFVGPRLNGKPRITRDAARQGRFAAHALQHQHPPRWRTDRVPAEQAWRRHHHAGFVAWAGPLFYPYAYTDMFYYPFWPDSYDDAYWPYVYDDFLDSIYWANGNPYSDAPYAAPTAVSVVGGGTSSSRNRTAAAAGACGSNAGITAWPFARIATAVKPTAEQQALLDELKTAAAQAADGLKGSCPKEASLTPPGRLDAMVARLQATLNAIQAVHAPLLKFYDSLTDEQKARFNGLGPDAGPKATAVSDAGACSGEKSGLADLPVEGIEDAVHPTPEQQGKLDALGAANVQAVAILQAACPDDVPQTPVGRIEAMEKRLDAMIQASKAIQPALQDFYGSLSDEQKSHFNTLGQQTQ